MSKDKEPQIRRASLGAGATRDFSEEISTAESLLSQEEIQLHGLLDDDQKRESAQSEQTEIAYSIMPGEESQRLFLGESIFTYSYSSRKRMRYTLMPDICSIEEPVSFALLTSGLRGYGRAPEKSYTGRPNPIIDGALASEIASRQALYEHSSSKSLWRPPECPEDLLNVFETLNTLIYDQRNKEIDRTDVVRHFDLRRQLPEDKRLLKIGTSATAVLTTKYAELFDDDSHELGYKFYILSIGNTRAYIQQEDNSIRQLTNDDMPTDRIPPPDLINALGFNPSVEITPPDEEQQTAGNHFVIQANIGQTLFLCSSNIETKDIEDYMRLYRRDQKKSLEATAEGIVLETVSHPKRTRLEKEEDAGIIIIHCV